MPKVYLASDHAGFALKQALIPYIGTLGHAAEDMGAHEEVSGDDYPDYVLPCAERVAAEAGSFGIVIGGSGQGEAMAANRVRGARAAVFYGGNPEIPQLAREHNDANILSLGARFASEEEAKEAVRAFLATPFSGEERHARRLGKF
ncbi:MAG TPA: RpiB/LacA/LacB family sugar-phosphate isomerase [Candidatus Paceibacterota bacterium]|nr:RpiB/LacA/LacB family sugar-phosphate isomerase [Candidatus Paceibacterota bacterium]